MQLLSMIVVCCLVVVYLAKGLVYLCCSSGVVHACMRQLACSSQVGYGYSKQVGRWLAVAWSCIVVGLSCYCLILFCFCFFVCCQYDDVMQGNTVTVLLCACCRVVLVQSAGSSVMCVSVGYGQGCNRVARQVVEQCGLAVRCQSSLKGSAILSRLLIDKVLLINLDVKGQQLNAYLSCFLFHCAKLRHEISLVSK